MATDRRTFVKAAGVTGLLGLSGCSALEGGGSGAQTTQTGTTGESGNLPEVEMTFAHGYSQQHQVHVAATGMKQYLETQTDGSFTVDIVPDAAAGDDIEQIEQTMDGTIEATSTFEGSLSQFYSNISVVNIPFLFQDVELANYVFDSEYGQRLYDDLRDSTGLRMVGHFDNGGMRHFTTNGAQITSIDDFQGLQIRVPGSATNQALVQALGAEAVTVDGTELYSALDQGVADGQENSIPIITSLNFYEVQDFCLLSGHMFSQTHMVVNDSWFTDLPPEYQRLVQAAGKQGVLNARAFTSVQRGLGRDLMENNGMEIHDPSDEFVNNLVETGQQPVTDEIRNDVDDEQWVDDLFDAVEQAEEDLGYN